jgi:nucleoside-diphosphate-sugar epimerase
VKLAIFGATGGTGKLLVEQALDSGYEVVVLVRDPTQLTAKHQHLTVVSGDVTDSAVVGRVVAGAEAIISVLGPRANNKGKPITLGTQNILAAMKKHGVRRIILSSTPSAFDPDDVPDLRFKLAIGMIRLVARFAYEDIVSTARAIRESDRDWTIVRVSMLSNARKTGIVSRDMGMHITRADLAEFLLKQVQDTKYLRQAPAISN